MVSRADFIEPADWTRGQLEGRSEAWLYFYKQGWIEGYAQGQSEKAKSLIQSLLKKRFGVVDKELSSIIAPLIQIF